LLNLALYGRLVVFFWSAGAALGFGLFIGTNVGLLLLLFIGWGLALVSLGFFISSFLSSRRVATIVGYVIALFGSLTAEVLAVGVYGDVPPFSSGGRMPPWLFAFPIIGLTRAVYLMNFDCIFKSDCMSNFAASMDPNNSDLYASILSLYVCAIVYMLAALYLEAVLPKQYGIPAHFLFCCPKRVQRTATITGQSISRALDCCWKYQQVDSHHAEAVSPKHRIELLHSAISPSLGSLSLNQPLLTASDSDARINTPLAIAVPRDAAAAAAQRGRFTSASSTATLTSALSPSSCAALSERNKAAAHVAASGWGQNGPTPFVSYAPFTSMRFPSLFSHARQDLTAIDQQAVGTALSQTLGETGDVPPGVLDALAYATGEDTTVVAERIGVEQSVSHASGEIVSNAPLTLRHVRKTFGNGSNNARGKVAVSDMTLQVQAGETFGLLGENGAGKSTLINLITGVFPPTSGQAAVCGHSVSSGIDAVHGVTGMCPQHSLLWEDMTVEEHLLFFARLKGVLPELEHAHIQAAAREVGLWKVRHRLAGGLSGGMKRRLSVAIAMIDTSGCKLVLLDEPSAGLDPASRRQLWRVIARAKAAASRGIILVSHAMDEIELLSTRIGIMTHGRLRVLDTQAALRNKYGGGLYLSINFPASDEGLAAAWVVEMFPGATLESQFKSFASFFLPQGMPGSEIWSVFGLMHAAANASAGITDWAVGQVTLDTVFQTVVKAHQNEKETV
jgi:ABC-type multidrug transport system ATPase subunit